MKNVLIIVAHPKVESLTMAMALKYEELAKKQGSSVELLDLYRCEHQQPFFTYNNDKSLEKTKEMLFFQEKISSADEIVFFFPYWWGTFPAILKNFIDWNFSKGYAYIYEGSFPKGLLKGRSVKIFTTTGAPKFIYMLTGANSRLKNMFKAQIINFCGMKLDSFNVYGGIDTSKKNAEDIFEDIQKRV